MTKEPSFGLVQRGDFDFVKRFVVGHAHEHELRCGRHRSQTMRRRCGFRECACTRPPPGEQSNDGSKGSRHGLRPGPTA